MQAKTNHHGGHGDPAHSQQRNTWEVNFGPNTVAGQLVQCGQGWCQSFLKHWPFGPCGAESFTCRHLLEVLLCGCSGRCLGLPLQAPRPADPPVKGPPGPGRHQLAAGSLHPAHLHRDLLQHLERCQKLRQGEPGRQAWCPLTPHIFCDAQFTC